MSIYFSDIFSIDESLIDEYGAMNITLFCDMPLFIDPFLLYASEKPEYKELHYGIIKYINFLREKAQGELSEENIRRWYTFPEVKQNWLGYSQNGNAGQGLGIRFGLMASNQILSAFPFSQKEKITETLHLEKLSLFGKGIGRDNISDFTCNLIKHYLLKFTEGFATKYLNNNQCKRVSVEKVCFDYETEAWLSKSFSLPYHNGDYVILTPKDLLTKDETWINAQEMKTRFLEIVKSYPNDTTRNIITDLYKRELKGLDSVKAKTDAFEKVLKLHPELMDYYIRLKEQEKELAKSNSLDVINETELFFVENAKKLAEALQEYISDKDRTSLEEARARVLYLKSFIEDKDGYRLFYHKGIAIQQEKNLQLLFKLCWFNSSWDVNAEVNNGRGSVDFKVSKGAYDSTLVEFKLASNSKLKQNLENQVEIYKKANNTNNSIKAILYFNEKEFEKLNKILDQIGLTGNENIITIDACNNKKSASNVK